MVFYSIVFLSPNKEKFGEFQLAVDLCYVELNNIK